MASRVERYSSGKRSLKNQYLYQLIDHVFKDDRAKEEIEKLEKATEYDIDRLEKILKGYQDYKKEQEQERALNAKKRAIEEGLNLNLRSRYFELVKTLEDEYYHEHQLWKVDEPPKKEVKIKKQDIVEELFTNVSKEQEKKKKFRNSVNLKIKWTFGTLFILNTALIVYIIYTSI